MAAFLHAAMTKLSRILTSALTNKITMQVRVALLLLAVFGSFSGFGQETSLQGQDSCTPVDLRTGPKGFLLTEPNDQGSIGWCYAYAASDLISFKLGKQVSAAYLSFAANRAYREKSQKENEGFFRRLFYRKSDSDTSIREGGYIDDVVSIFNKQGACSESKLSSKETVYGFNGVIWRTLGELHNTDKTKFSTYRLAERCKSMQTEYELLKKVFAGLDQETFAKIFFELSDQDAEIYFDEIAKAYCGKNNLIFADGPLILINVSSSSQVRMTTIDSQLTNGNPLGISYYTKKFVDRTTDGYHASVVIGRRWKDGACQYLIRNSWGQSCSTYRPETTDCEEKSGSFWVKGSDLESAVRNVTYIP
jgi:hypothetical protein